MPLDFLFIFVLILANGFFAASELAVVSSRQGRLQAKAEAGSESARAALQLRQKPNKFLATVQVGITLVGTLASAVGGVEAVNWLSPLIARIPLLQPYASQIALTSVVLMISYITLLFGELVPKRLAIRNPEGLAMAVAQFFEVLARIVRLPIWVLMASADLVMRLFRDVSAEDQAISPDEIEVLVRRGTAEGVILPVQEKMIARIFDYADRATRDEMTPRTEIVAFEANTSLSAALQMAKDVGYSRFPVYRHNLDHIFGYVHIKDLIWAQEGTSLESLTRPVVFIPEGVSLPQAFKKLTRSGQHLAIVLDEYGGTEGLITLENLLEVIVGEIEDEHSPLAEMPEKHAEDHWEFAGSSAIVEVGELLEVDFEANGVYNTLAGFIMSELGAIPKEGDMVFWNNFNFIVEEMDRFRILRVSVHRVRSSQAKQTLS
jgi:putative hemolysin